MRFVLLNLFFVLAILLQTTFFSFLTLDLARPDLVGLLVVCYAFWRGSREGAFLGFIGGLWEDLLTGYHLGLNAFTKLVIAWMAGLLAANIYRESSLIASFIVFLAIIGDQVLQILVLKLIGYQIMSNWLLLRAILLTALTTALFTPLVYPLICRAFAQREWQNW